MKSLKMLFFTLSALSLVGCSSNTVETDASTDTSADVSTEAPSESEESSSTNNESEISDSSELEESELEEPEIDETSITEASNDLSDSDTSLSVEEVEEGSPEQVAIEAVIEVEEEIDTEDPSGYQFLVTEDGESIYQVEVRVDNEDGSVSNLLGTYEYEVETGRVLKQNIETSEFEYLS